jgi:hypothetical protein
MLDSIAKSKMGDDLEAGNGDIGKLAQGATEELAAVRPTLLLYCKYISSLRADMSKNSFLDLNRPALARSSTSFGST